MNVTHHFSRLHAALSNSPLLTYLVISLAISCYVFFDFIVLDKVYLFKDIGSDTLNVFLPNFILISEYAHDGYFPSTWSFRQGMGQDIFPGSFGDPFNWIYYVIGGLELSYAIAYVEISKIIIGGLLIVSILKINKISGITSVIGGLIYAFSGFMIVGGGWYVFSSEAVYFALLILSFEIYLASRRWYLIPLAVFLVGANSPFNYYLYSLFALIYLVAKSFLVTNLNVKSYWRDVAWIVVYGALGVGMSAVFSLGGAVQMLGSARVSGEASFFETLMSRDLVAPIYHYMTSAYRLFSSDLLGTGSRFYGWGNYLEAPMHYAGLLALVLLPQLFINFSVRRRVIFLVLLVLVLSVLGLPHVRNAFWLFAGDYYRGISLIVIGYLIFSQTFLLHKYELGQVRFNPYVLVITVAGCLLLLFWPVGEGYRVVDDTRNIVVIFLLLYAAVLFAARLQVRREVVMALLLLVMSVELAVFSHESVTNRITMTSEELASKSGYNDYTADAVRFIKKIDDGFYRISKDYYSGSAIHRGLNDAKVQGYYGTSSYHSFNHPEYLGFLSSLGVISPENEGQTRWAPDLNRRPMLQNITSHKYHLSKRARANVPPNYSLFSKVGDVYIYKNNYFIGLGVGYGKYIRMSEFKKLSLYQKDIALMQAVAVDDDKTNLIGLIELKANDVRAKYGISQYLSDISARKALVAELLEFNEDEISARFYANNPQIVFLSIPYDSGWIATVNGKEEPLVRINGGLTGLYLAPGEQDIQLRYRPRHLFIGLIFSLLSFVVLIWLIIRSYLKNTKACSNEVRSTDGHCLAAHWKNA